MRPNVLWPSPRGIVRFVGGLPSPYYPDVDLDHVYQGEVIDRPVFSDGATWVRIHVPGVADDFLVPVENLRP